MSVIELASSRSIRPFKSSEEYVYAMKEDLAEWLKDLYGVDVNVKNLVQMLQTGSLLCLHANNVTRAAADFLCRQGAAHLQLPASGVSFIGSAQPSTFQARDNVSNFINWCRTEMHIKDVLMFETDDLVLRKNEKNVVLCLLEVARRASRFGMAAPVLIQLEQEIEEEMRVEDSPEQEAAPKPGLTQKRSVDIQNLDEMVQCLTSRCTCPTQFPVVKISEGKYRVGDSNTLIFVRILRNHVMVRVGGGWDTLEHYLDKHDPCRCTSLTHKLAQYPGTPVHEIKARQCRPDGQATSQTSLLLSRVQSPVDPVIWTPSGPSRIHRSDPGLRSNSSPTKPTSFKSKDDSVLQSSSRTSREPNRASPAPRLSSSLNRAQTRRPSTPLVLQKVDGQPVPKPQQDMGMKLGQTFTKTQFVSKLRQNAVAGTRNNPEVQSFSVTSNASENSPGNRQPPTISVQESQDNRNARKKPDFIRTFCPTKGRLGAISSGEAHARFVTSTEKTHLSENTVPNCLMSVSQSDMKVTEPFQTLCVVGASHRNGYLEKRHLFTPSPISPAQEAVLYQSLEEEILSNLKQLGMDSDGSDSESERYGSSETPLNSPEDSNTSDTFTKDAIKPEHFTGDPSCLKVSRSSSSWSSLGSSFEAPKGSHQSMKTDLTPRNRDSGVNKTEKPLSSSGKRRSLKKPERVPSIYKLKLRPCVRPRRDNRPDKKPTKIPRPVYYGRNQSDSTQSSEHQSARASTRRSSRKNLKFSPRAGRGAKRQGDREPVGDEEHEYWV